tara:strand:+ start:72 stop:659 length:588 start_codon:yes stop_codon:yes gene_type:complete
MELKNKNILYILYVLVFSSCSFYSFKGSLPAHIDNIYISPIINNSKEYIVLDVFNTEIYDIFLSENLLKLSSVGDAKSRLEVKIISVTDRPFTYSLDDNSVFYEQVDEWKITIKANVEWYDIVKDEIIFAKEITSFGIYSTNGSNDILDDGIDNDQDGLIDSDDDDEFGPPRDSALKIASKKMSENIIANITSTW